MESKSFCLLVHLMALDVSINTSSQKQKSVAPESQPSKKTTLDLESG